MWNAMAPPHARLRPWSRRACLDHSMTCAACKALFDEPTTKPAHARLIAESVGVLPGDGVYRCKDCSTRWLRRGCHRTTASVRDSGFYDLCARRKCKSECLSFTI